MKNLFEYDVYDRNHDRVGYVENLWANQRDEIGFIGVKTGWLGFGRNHVIPAEGYTVDEDAHSILVPFDGELIKNAPSLDADEELEPELEQEVYSHFGLTGAAAASNTLPADAPVLNEPEIQRGDEPTLAADADLASHETFGQQRPLSAEGDSTFGSRQTTSGQTASGETIEMPLAEERLEVGKREHQIGEVRLRKVVRTETVNQPVELRREDVVIERVSGSGQPAQGEPFAEQVATIPLTAEEAVVHKSVESAGAIQAHKVSETSTEQVRETLRKEDVEVERSQNKDQPHDDPATPFPDEDRY